MPICIRRLEDRILHTNMGRTSVETDSILILINSGATIKVHNQGYTWGQRYHVKIVVTGLCISCMYGGLVYTRLPDLA